MDKNSPFVFHFCSDLSPSAGGLASSVVSLLSNLSPHLSRKLMVFTYKSCSLSSFLFNRNLFVLQSRWHFFVILTTIFRECRFRSRPIFHCHGPWSALTLFAIFISVLFRAKVLLASHGMFDPWGLNRKKFKKSIGIIIYRFFLNRFIDAYLVNSDLEKKSVLMIFPYAKVHVISHGITISDSFSEERVKKRYESNIYLFLSRIFPGKGLEELLVSWRDCALGNASLFIAGSGEPSYVSKFTEFVSSNSLGDSVRFLGFVESPRKEQIYDEARFFVLPSHSENFGMVVLEAMAQGVPCIVSNRTPWVSIQSDQVGYVVENSSVSISEALKQSFSLSFPLYLQMSRNSFDFAQRFSWGRIIPMYLALYTMN